MLSHKVLVNNAEEGCTIKFVVVIITGSKLQRSVSHGPILGLIIPSAPC